ncbi:transmembrane protein 235-like [Hypomesus transpacificus]|uniref:transmembrane protein 235-like n=1 Tax=Hypomesus transpacificus TaxID=137520 RepID=UPI001F087B34|nr:transmembrane protein 235-like [Hypomesus transpacificus]
MRYGVVILVAGFTGLLSFALLAVAIGSEYWYIIDVKPNHPDFEDLSSHSGLWRIYEGKNASSHLIHSFTMDTSTLSEVERHLIKLHKAIVILLPISLVLLVFGWISGLVSSLAHSPCLISGSASYFLLCSLFTLSGVSVYISYCQQALAELQQVLGPEELSLVDVSFGWSLAMAWLSYSLEVTTGLLLILAARIAQLQGHRDSGIAIAMV